MVNRFRVQLPVPGETNWQVVSTKSDILQWVRKDGRGGVVVGMEAFRFCEELEELGLLRRVEHRGKIVIFESCEPLS